MTSNLGDGELEIHRRSIEGAARDQDDDVVVMKNVEHSDGKQKGENPSE
jgi:hypothetical protein